MDGTVTSGITETAFFCKTDWSRKLGANV